MDIQLKRGLLEICVLAALWKEDSYGYKIIKDIESVIEISESTLYPILRRLENNSLLSVYTIEYQGRLRKYYQLTPSGRQRVHDFQKEWQQMTNVYNFISQTTGDDCHE